MCSENLVKKDTIHRLNYNDKEIVIVATAHVSRESKEEVKKIIEEEKPDSVCIELDESRFKSLTDKDKYSNMDIVQVIKEGKATFVLANLFLASFQKKIANKLDIEPGAEMIQGINSAKEIDAEIVLADRSIHTTFKRIWRKSTFGEKFKLLYQILGTLVVSEKEIEEKQIEEMKTSDMLDSALSVIGETFPLIKEILIDERDIFLANKIKEAPGKKIVAVLGAGHVPGVKKIITEQKYGIPTEIEDKKFNKKVLKNMLDEDKEITTKFYLKNESDNKYRLKEDINNEEEQNLLNILYDKVPETGIASKIVGWALPILLVVWIISGFFTGQGFDNLWSYILGTGIGAGLGSLISLAHPLTILVGMFLAPITVLHPVLGVGWFTGLSEAFLRKPKVSDLENLGNDVQSIKGFFKNRFTHILLVIFISSIGTILGIFIGIPLFSRLFY